MYSSEDLRDFFKGYKSEAVVKEHRFYSVLIPLVEREGKMHVLLEKRAAHISQPGEICFPGGRIEAGEPPQAAALRECNEEIGVPVSEIKLLAQGDTLYGQADFTIYSFIAEISEASYERIKIEKDEVEELYLIPLSYFVENDPEFYKEKYETNIREFPYDKVGIPPDYEWRRGTMRIPIYESEGIVIWGMTAQFINRLSTKLREEAYESDNTINR